VTFSTSIEGSSGNIGQVAVATPIAGGTQYGGRLFGGQAVTWNAVNVPTGALLGAQLIGIGGSSPGLSLPTITAPGCVLSTTLSPILWETFFLPPNSVTGTVPFTIAGGYNPGVLGFNLYAQFVLLDGLFSGGDLISAASNAIKHTVGLN
jgi:hypothetical protein